MAIERCLAALSVQETHSRGCWSEYVHLHVFFYPLSSLSFFVLKNVGRFQLEAVAQLCQTDLDPATIEIAEKVHGPKFEGSCKISLSKDSMASEIGITKTSETLLRFVLALYQTNRLVENGGNVECTCRTTYFPIFLGKNLRLNMTPKTWSQWDSIYLMK